MWLEIKWPSAVSNQTHIASISINKMVQTCFNHFKNLSRTRSMLSFKDCEIIVLAFVSSRHDMVSCLSNKSLSRLQLVQNASAKLLTGTSRREHLSPIFASLHWLPVRFRIDFNILLITLNAIHVLALRYISDLSTPCVSSAWNSSLLHDLWLPILIPICTCVVVLWH